MSDRWNDSEGPAEATVGGMPEPMEAEAHKNVHAALSYVMERVAFVAKQHAPGLSYSFAGEEGLIDAVRDEVVAAGLVLTIDDVQVVGRGTYATAKGSTMQSTVLRLSGRWTHWPTGTETPVCAMGEGADVGDKSVPKAMTGAYKYIVRETFLLKTGDDPDLHASEPRAAGGPQAPQDAREAPGRPQAPAAPRSAPAGAQGAPGGKAGRGGPDQLCPQCGAQGITPRGWDPSTRRPDAQCPGRPDGSGPCRGNPRQDGNGFWPLAWWTVPKAAGASGGASGGKSRLGPTPPATAQDKDIPF